MAQPWILDYDPANCAVGAAVEIIGEKWTFLVLREVFSGVRRFGDMQRRTGAPRQILSDRLSRLVHEGLLRRVPYQEAGHDLASPREVTTEPGPGARRIA